MNKDTHEDNQIDSFEHNQLENNQQDIHEEPHEDKFEEFMKSLIRNVERQLIPDYIQINIFSKTRNMLLYNYKHLTKNLVSCKICVIFYTTLRVCIETYKNMSKKWTLYYDLSRRKAPTYEKLSLKNALSVRAH